MTELKTYAELAALWGVSREAARKKVEGLRLPRQRGNDGRTLVMIDLAEVQHGRRSGPGDHLEAGSPPAGDRVDLLPETGRPPIGDQPDPNGEVRALVEHVGTLRAALERVELEAARERQRADQERARVDELQASLLRATASEMRTAAERDVALAEKRAVETRAADLSEELRRLRTRTWWRRMVG